jgi:hypothetical protein
MVFVKASRESDAGQMPTEDLIAAMGIAWLKKAPFDGGTEVELRPIFEAEDFGAALTPELREREKRLRAQLEQQQHPPAH